MSWRRGTDLESIHQLVIGDEIFLKCARVGANDPVVATVVAAVERDDGVRLTPRHITAVSACLGRLIAITSNTLSVKNDEGGCVIRTNGQTTFWRGETYHDASAFKLGDEVYANRTRHRVAGKGGRNNGHRTRLERNAGDWLHSLIQSNVLFALRRKYPQLKVVAGLRSSVTGTRYRLPDVCVLLAAPETRYVWLIDPRLRLMWKYEPPALTEIQGESISTADLSVALSRSEIFAD